MRLASFLTSLITIVTVIASCDRSDQYKADLLSDDKYKIDLACLKLGKLKDTSAIRPLLTKILDPRISHSMKFYGMSVNYCRLVALKKISGRDIGRRFDQFGPDTIATLFYLDWAIEEGYLKDWKDVDIYYYK